MTNEEIIENGRRLFRSAENLRQSDPDLDALMKSLWEAVEKKEFFGVIEDLGDEGGDGEWICPAYARNAVVLSYPERVLGKRGRNKKPKTVGTLTFIVGATAEGLSIDEIAAEMEVSRRTAQRMRAALDLVFPIETLRDGQTLRYRLQGHLPAAVLAPQTEELASLDLAIATFQNRGETENADRLDNLRLRMLAALRDRDRRRLAPDLELLAKSRIPIAVPGPRTPIPRNVQNACHLALLAGAILSFKYAAAHGTRHHEVASRGLLVGARSYLVAASNDWGDPVLFRLDRMSDPKVLERPAWPDEAFDLDEFAARSFGIFQEEPEEVVLRFDSTAHDEASAFRFHPDQETRTLPDGRLEVQFCSGGFLELAWHLFRWSGVVEIVAPEVLKNTMREQLQKSEARL